MTLPVGTLGTDTFDVDGVSVTIRSLSASQAFGLNDYLARKAEAPAYIIAHGTGASEEETKAFLDSHKLETSVQLVNAILELSGLDETFRARISDTGRTRPRRG